MTPSHEQTHHRPQGSIFQTTAVGELREVSSRPRITKRCHLSPSEIEDVLTLIDLDSLQVPGTAILPIAVRDPKDQKILASAIEGEADYLVTSDADLLILNGNPTLGKLRIVTVRDFLAILFSLP